MSRLNYILPRHRTQSRTFAYMINSWYPVCPWFDLARRRRFLDPNYLKTLKERERERETSAYILISCNLEKYHASAWRCFSCASAFARQSRIFDSIDALHAFYRMAKCLIWRNILSWIPFGSDLDPNCSSFFKGERIQISLKAVHHRPASMAQRWMLAW